MRRDAVAGVLLANAIPHLVIGWAGKRGMTPLGGRDCSAGRNLVWAGMNLAGAGLALGSGGWRTASQGEVDRRVATVQFGMLAMALFSAGYNIVVGGYRIHPVRDRWVEPLRTRRPAPVWSAWR